MSASSTIDIPRLRGPVSLAHLILARFVLPGDSVIDATCGNGNDTLALAGLTGEAGRVWAFDIQDRAIERTSSLLLAAGLQERVTMVRAGHETMREHVTGPVRAAVFNLGYLPGGERSIITRPESTLSALGQALELLAPGGIVTVTLYPGHAGGGAEQSAVETWASRLSPRNCHVWRMGQLNVAADAPRLILAQKTS